MLLFFIIAVAGFGILATFSMIVVEKTRDIGILKALGASSGGRPPDLPGLRTAAWAWSAAASAWSAGWLFVWNINYDREAAQQGVTGRKVFDDAIYYFDMRYRPGSTRCTVAWIVGGARSSSPWPPASGRPSARPASEAGPGPSVRVNG